MYGEQAAGFQKEVWQGKGQKGDRNVNICSYKIINHGDTMYSIGNRVNKIVTDSLCNVYTGIKLL